MWIETGCRRWLARDRSLIFWVDDQSFRDLEPCNGEILVDLEGIRRGCSFSIAFVVDSKSFVDDIDLASMAFDFGVLNLVCSCSCAWKFSYVAPAVLRRSTDRVLVEIQRLDNYRSRFSNDWKV